MATKEELLKNLTGKNDEIKLELLERITKSIDADQETRKQAFILMTEVYIKKMWWSNTAKAFMNAALGVRFTFGFAAFLAAFFAGFFAIFLKFYDAM